MVFKMLHSPLAGTAAVLATLGLLAMPLHRLTSSRPTPSTPRIAAKPSADSLTPAILRLKLLTPARSIRLKTEAGKMLLDLTEVTAGESEYDASLPIRNDTLDLLLDADLGDSQADTAVFLTVMPDAREGQTHFIIGSGALTQPLRFNWHSH